MSSVNPTARFSNRVEDYARYRPGYPAAIIEFFTTRLGITKADVADVGSGTGIFTALLLDAGHRVFAIEPNDAMRAEAERTLGGREGFVSVDGSAEQTTIDDASVDLITAAQAFHWFDVPATRAEFRRILRADGIVAL